MLLSTLRAAAGLLSPDLPASALLTAATWSHIVPGLEISDVVSTASCKAAIDVDGLRHGYITNGFTQLGPA